MRRIASRQPADQECKYEAHAKVHAAASDGGWTFCPICEVACLTALFLEASGTLKEAVDKYDKLARMLLKRSDLEKDDIRKTEKWLDEVRAIVLPMNPDRPTESVTQKSVSSPRGRGRSRSKGDKT